VRHITPENINDPYVTLDERNFQRLCVDCHAAVHSGCERPRVAFDEMGNVVRRA
jgi:predicted HNH restriction endonuclease